MIPKYLKFIIQSSVNDIVKNCKRYNININKDAKNELEDEIILLIADRLFGRIERLAQNENVGQLMESISEWLKQNKSVELYEEISGADKSAAVALFNMFINNPQKIQKKLPELYEYLKGNKHPEKKENLEPEKEQQIEETGPLEKEKIAEPKESSKDDKNFEDMLFKSLIKEDKAKTGEDKEEENGTENMDEKEKGVEDMDEEKESEKKEKEVKNKTDKGNKLINIGNNEKEDLFDEDYTKKEIIASYKDEDKSKDVVNRNRLNKERFSIDKDYDDNESRGDEKDPTDIINESVPLTSLSFNKNIEIKIPVDKIVFSFTLEEIKEYLPEIDYEFDMDRIDEVVKGLIEYKMEQYNIISPSGIEISVSIAKKEELFKSDIIVELINVFIVIDIDLFDKLDSFNTFKDKLDHIMDMIETELNQKKEQLKRDNVEFEININRFDIIRNNPNILEIK